MSNKGIIETWFPTSIYIVDLKQYNFNDMINEVKTIKFKSNRNELLARDSYADDVKHIENSLHKNPIFINLFDDIKNHAKQFLSHLGYKFLDNIKITNSWFNIYNKGDFVHKHIHQGSVLSGAYYLKSSEKDLITFYAKDDPILAPDNPTNLSLDSCNYVCEQGRLLLFKSSTAHSTNKQELDEKIVLSFNMGFN